MGLKIDRAKCVPSRPPPPLGRTPSVHSRGVSVVFFLREARATDGLKPTETARRESRRYWLSVGAQPSDTVARLFGQAGIIPAPPRKGLGAKKVPWTRGFAASADR